MDISTITQINTVIVLLFCALSAYQYVYILVSILFPVRRFSAEMTRRYAVLICARNEESVIAQLIDSIHRQTYPSDLLDVYVMADNCTDQTRAVAEAAGAITFERADQEKVGKGYALDALCHCVWDRCGQDYYDAFFVFDADNLLAPDYVEQMNRVFSNGFQVVTSYRNSKNFGDNWITAGYGIMFMREARHMNNARMILHTSSNISGTGFMVSSAILQKAGGWPYHCLTEDLEFTMDQVSSGVKIGYCHDAVFYDEQPTKFIQSWRQRIRWTKGFMQAMLKHGYKILRGIFRRDSSFSCFDEIMSTLPTMILAVFAAVSAASMIFSWCTGAYNGLEFLWAFFGYFLGIYGINYALGLLTVITEWKKIAAPAWKKIACTFTYPIFVMVGIPINIVSLFVRAQWHPIQHTDATTIDQLQNTHFKTD